MLDLEGEGYTDDGQIDCSFDEPKKQSYTFGQDYKVPAKVASDIYYNSQQSAVLHLSTTYFANVGALVVDEENFYTEVFSFWRNSLPNLKVCILARKDGSFEVA